MVLAKAMKKNNFNCCYENFPFSAFMMMNAHLYFSICSCKNVEGNELAQQKLKPKLISRCSKCWIASLFMGTSAANSEKNTPTNETALKPGIDGRESIKALLLFSPASRRLHARAQQAQTFAANHQELCPATWGTSVGSHRQWCQSLASPSLGWPVPAKALYELSEAGCCAAHRVLPSFHPALPHLHNWLRHYLPCSPCRVFGAPASLGLFVSINNFPAESLLRWGWEYFKAETLSLHSCLFNFADLFHT